MRKKLILMLSISGLILVGTQSCRKKEGPPKPAIQETINVQLKVNEVYTFVLPENKRDDDYQISTNAAHAKISQLGKDASGNQIYQYTPVLDFAGTDQVIVSNDEELREHHDHQGPPPHGGCNKGGEEDHYIVTINFTIANPTRLTSISH